MPYISKGWLVRTGQSSLNLMMENYNNFVQSLTLNRDSIHARYGIIVAIPECLVSCKMSTIMITNTGLETFKNLSVQ